MIVSFVSAATGQETKIEVDESLTVADVCQLLVQKENLEGTIKLIYSDTQLNPTTVFKDIGYDAAKSIQFKVEPKNPPHKSKGLTRALPKRSDKVEKQIRQPENFSELVKNLMEMGGGAWTQENCEKALRVALYNVGRASDFLISNNIPDQPTAALSDPPKPKPKEPILSEEEKQVIKRIQEKFSDRDIGYLDIAQYYVACEKDEEQTIALIENL